MSTNYPEQLRNYSFVMYGSKENIRHRWANLYRYLAKKPNTAIWDKSTEPLVRRLRRNGLVIVAGTHETCDEIEAALTKYGEKSSIFVTPIKGLMPDRLSLEKLDESLDNCGLPPSIKLRLTQAGIQTVRDIFLLEVQSRFSPQELLRVYGRVCDRYGETMPFRRPRPQADTTVEMQGRQ